MEANNIMKKIYIALFVIVLVIMSPVFLPWLVHSENTLVIVLYMISRACTAVAFGIMAGEWAFLAEQEEEEKGSQWVF